MRELKKCLLTSIMVINPVSPYSQISETEMLCICCANTKKRNYTKEKEIGNPFFEFKMLQKYYAKI